MATPMRSMETIFNIKTFYENDLQRRTVLLERSIRFY